MSSRLRLDSELVRRGLARSREHASELIGQGRVKVSGVRATKPATGVSTDVALVVVDDPEHVEFVSRGGYKLAGALATFRPHGLVVADRRALDAGASTGGFTDVLLRNLAAQVIAVDVGYGQLAWSLQQDPRVVVLDRTNIRTLTPEMLPGPPDMVVGDLSFISLRLVLPAIVGVASTAADVVLMVKPQFEVGRDRLGKTGVVRDPELRAGAVLAVAHAAQSLGLGCRGVCASPLPGPAGNVEYFLWLQRDAPPIDADTVRLVVAEGPQ